MHERKHSDAASVDRLLTRVRRLRRDHRYRRSTRRFVIEGIRQFVQASIAGSHFDTLIHSPLLLQHGFAQQLIRRLTREGVARVSVNPEAFRSISTTQRASGIIAIAHQRWTPLIEADPHRGIGWLVVQQIRSAGNLGTIIRTAEAAGMSGMIFVGDASNPYDPHVVRASMGGIFRLPLVRTTARELSYWLARHNVAAVGLSPHASQNWTQLPAGPSHALLLGEERQGLSPALRRLADCDLRLPMTAARIHEMWQLRQAS
jgi:TrmH family RNA methyltransferase